MFIKTRICFIYDIEYLLQIPKNMSYNIFEGSDNI